MLTEQEKYEEAYRHDNYGLRGPREHRVRSDVDAIPLDWSYLDVGCGRGESVKFAKKRGIAARGLELVSYLATGDVVHGKITALPFADDEFDQVSCYDVIEHLPPGETDKALSELTRVAKRVLIVSTNNRDSFGRAPDGERIQLHINKRSRDEWLRLIERAAMMKNPAATVVSSVFGTSDWHFAVSLG